MISWLKRNKLVAALIAVILYLVYTRSSITPFSLNKYSAAPVYDESVAAPLGSSLNTGNLNRSLTSQEPAPSSQKDRLVVQESNLSLVVKNVRSSVDAVLDYTKSIEGYMVSSSLSQPEETPYAYVILRLPSEKLKEALEFFRSQSIKVSSENLLGTDVTDEYVDIEARLETLSKTKAKFEEIMNQASKIPDLLEVQRELINLQDQIDNLKGRQQYLEKTAQMAKISLHLSTDEFSLPYAPAAPFRPGVIFKYAVRSLVGALRSVVSALIWIGVYSVIWLPIVVLFWFLKRRRQKI